MVKYTVIIIAVCALLLVSQSIKALDSIQHVATNRKFTGRMEIVVPATLITAGLLTYPNVVKQGVGNVMPGTRYYNADYIQYFPMLQMYLANLACDARHSLFDQTKYLVISQIVSAAVVQTLKYTVREQRPAKGRFNSFPSGHTCVAFVGATALYHEFKDANRFIAYSGFAVATAVGMLRMTNRKHWLPDVLAGAGTGMLVTNLIYRWEPLKNWQPFGNTRVTALPYYDGCLAGVSVKVRGIN
jgi:hypothetical protein